MSNSHARDGAFNLTSPRSSNGVADSFKGTPDTRLTAFSPEDGSTKSLRAPHSVGINGRESGPVKFNVSTPASLNLPRREPLFPRDNNVDRDPFVGSGGPSSRITRKLSPTADCFAPLSGFAGTHGSEPDLSCVKNEDGDEVHDILQNSASDRGTNLFVHSSLSTDLGLSRCVIVATTARGGSVQIVDVDRYISVLRQRGLEVQSSKQFYSYGDKVYVRFANIRDACLFSQNAKFGGHEWLINYIPPREFSQVVDPTSGLITAHEAQLTLTVFGPQTLQAFDLSQLPGLLQSILATQGDLFAFKVQTGGPQGNVLSAIVEYCDNDVSLRAVSELNGKVLDGFQILMTLHRPDIPNTTAMRNDRIVSPGRSVSTPSDLATDFQRISLARPASSISSVPAGYVHTPARSITSPGFSVQPSFGMMPLMYQGMPMSPQYMFDQMAPRAHGMFPTGNYSLGGPVYHQQSMMGHDFMVPRQFSFNRGEGRRQNAVRVHRAPYQHHNIGGQHNHVDVNRIREGIDVRTTIMLRNIPNKVDQAMLKRIVDESSWGKYDFMYLRIDFANDCNVGYAFINFVDPLDIIDFVNKRGNQRWNCFKSDKVAEISYATIQGKDCLVQKFRNSSVMLEAAHYRPKLYYTINGPRPDMAGQEEAFPEPDNQSKMKRSCENAEHVGLFTPNAGQHFRDEQRRRRSQYDRGTRLAAMEEYDFDSSFTPHHFIQ
ncbi:hypothetical protein JX265_009207 [Neoarthrinium moseri]|uniref:RRM domain-containing protein n=1 Tax=Neoarthrinium moseri TaxID=1658444 RepID=A0A9P9WGI4_9PEZI|nr:hypothetical protein JX265_009207 [Neoarthrinium moseri]